MLFYTGQTAFDLSSTSRHTIFSLCVGVHCDYCGTWPHADSVTRHHENYHLHGSLVLHALLTVSSLLVLPLRFCPSRGDAWRARTIPYCQKRTHIWSGKWTEPELHG